ncbi:hypothetical protein ST201phi2-1p418 [Pseudomonas phage 201phi2-1]|uniref:Uncharacterized protein n=1 Tax=Pseudomonas phage 201phi2-1 TaxID=198110 RepID=B3FJS7_BP201|nr:hypothetical protein ST201phi2-1p418 [Pseudomonas phage 201phi2-1]ABY63242.1 hypothetical protein 201phi2-1p418 [Pseudomonas phage 201phi2-1]
MSKSKRHNTVSLSIHYKNANDRTAFENELNLVQDLSTLMTASAKLHNHAADPLVRPQAYVKDVDDYYGSITLQFPLKAKWYSEENDMRCYSHVGLYNLLKLISDVCSTHSVNFEEFRTHLDLGGMKAPWVLPVEGMGVILREGSRQMTLTGDVLPRAVRLGVAEYEVEQLIVVGEPRAVEDFSRAWGHVADKYRRVMQKYPTHQYHGRGPLMDVSTMKYSWGNHNWQNVGVFALVKRPEFEPTWVTLGEMHNSSVLKNIIDIGNHMLNTPLQFSNTEPSIRNNIFLSDHAYYSFESVV